MSVLFEIEVISFVDPKSGEGIDELPSELRRGEVSFVDTLTKASSIKEVTMLVCCVVTNAKGYVTALPSGGCTPYMNIEGTC